MNKFRYLLVFVILAIGIFIFPHVAISKQEILVDLIIKVSSILFGIIGVWIAVLNPTSLLGKLPSENIDSKTKLAISLTPEFVSSTIVLVVAVVMRFVTVYLGEILFLTGVLLKIARFTYGLILTILLLMQLWSIFGTLIPIYRVHRKQKIDEYKKRTRN